MGYDFLKAIQDQNHHILVRVGSNITLLKNLGYYRESAGTVYIWPDKAARHSQLPLIFRHLVVQGQRAPVHLIVSVTNPRLLSDKQVAQIYRARWRIEVYYRNFKQTFGRRKLLSHRADHAHVELEWSLIALWGMCLYASYELDRRKIPLERMSMAGVLRAFRRIARDYLHPADSTPQTASKRCVPRSEPPSWTPTSVERKPAATPPAKNKNTPPAPPTIKTATPQDRKRLQQLTGETQHTQKG